MATYAMIAALGLFGVGFVTLLTAAFMKPENTLRLPIRLVGMYSTGASFLTMCAAFLLAGFLAHQLTLGDLLISGLAIYFGIDTIRKGRSEQRAARDKWNP